MAEEKPLSVGELEDLITKEMGELDMITDILVKKKSKFKNEALDEVENNVRLSMSIKKRHKRNTSNADLDKENIEFIPARRRSTSKRNLLGFGSSSSRNLFKTMDEPIVPKKECSRSKRSTRNHESEKKSEKIEDSKEKPNIEIEPQQIFNINIPPKVNDEKDLIVKASNPMQVPYNRSCSKLQRSLENLTDCPMLTKNNSNATSNIVINGANVRQSVKTNLTRMTSNYPSMKDGISEPEVFYNVDLDEVNEIKLPGNLNNNKNIVYDEDDLFSRLNKISQISENQFEDATNNESFNILKNFDGKSKPASKATYIIPRHRNLKESNNSSPYEDSQNQQKSISTINPAKTPSSGHDSKRAHSRKNS